MGDAFGRRGAPRPARRPFHLFIRPLRAASGIASLVAVYGIMRAVRILMVFVDGVGLGDLDPATNPLVRAETPTFHRLLGGPLAGRAVVRTEEAVLVPLDAQLGVPGFPQSATGQVALLTGENAPARVGHHVTAYPTQVLRTLLEECGLFTRLQRLEIGAALANAYSPEYFAAVAARRLRHAAIALNALQAGVRLRDVDDVRAGRAVCHDLTNARLREWGHAVPLIAPEEAGRNLAGLARDQAFTLFEFFQTDLAGHGRLDDRIGVVERLDRFLGAVLDATDRRDTLVLVTSDHGNLEDERTDGHTHNPVPALLVGAQRELVAERLRDLTDLAPACLDLLGNGVSVS
ncbi:MAG TPA: metalloenzyme [bacterium]|nr:metalloenzyme [bacterium]